MRKKILPWENKYWEILGKSLTQKDLKQFKKNFSLDIIKLVECHIVKKILMNIAEVLSLDHL